jgi:tetratricopeptide (TPR) repeat protein
MRARKSKLFASFIALGFVLSASPLPVAFGQDAQEEEQQNLQKAYMYFVQAQRLEDAGDLPGALALCQKAQVNGGGRAKELHHMMGKLYARLGEREHAIASFRSAIDIDSNYVEARNNYGAFCHRVGMDKDAETQWRQCIQIDPKYPFAYYNLGKMYKEKGDLDTAISNFESATQLKPNFAEAQEALGMAVFERASQGDLTLAADKLRTAEKLVPKNPSIHYHLGTIYATQSQLDAAETEFRNALMCDSRMAAAHFELGKLRYYRGDLDRALTEFKETSKINPTYTTNQGYATVDPIKLKTLVAQTYEHMGDLVNAIETWKELVAMRRSDVLYAKHIQELIKTVQKERAAQRKKPLPYDPDEVDAFISKGITAYEDGDLDGSRASFERALELNPTSFRAEQNLCFVQEAQGDLNQAIATAQKAIGLNKDYDGAVYNLAYLLEKGNLPDDAARMYQSFRLLANAYPYDPRHITELQQNIIREQKKEQYIRKRGY